MSRLYRTAAVCSGIVLLLLTAGRAASQIPPPFPYPENPPPRPGMPQFDPKDPHAFEAIFLPSTGKDDAKKKIDSLEATAKAASVSPTSGSARTTSPYR